MIEHFMFNVLNIPTILEDNYYFEKECHGKRFLLDKNKTTHFWNIYFFCMKLQQYIP